MEIFFIKEVEQALLEIGQKLIFCHWGAEKVPCPLGGGFLTLWARGGRDIGKANHIESLFIGCPHGGLHTAVGQETSFVEKEEKLLAISNLVHD